MGGIKLITQITKPVIIKLGRNIEGKRLRGVPIIIGACPRSGTTILLSILGAHPHIFAIPKQTYAFDLWAENPGIAQGHGRWQPMRMDRLYLQFLLHRIPKSANRWLEKTPRHVSSFDKILDYYLDRVKLINIIRDGRAVVTSRHPKHSPDAYWVSAERWVEDVTAGLQLDDHPSVLNLKYEDLINDFEVTITKVYEFIGEAKPDNLAGWIEKTNIKKSKHWGGPVQNLYAHALDRWRKPEHEERIKYFMGNREAVALLNKLGYPE